MEFLAEDGGILNLNVHAAGMVLLGLSGLHLLKFLLVVDLENGLAKDENKDDADYADRISHGITRSHRGRLGHCRYCIGTAGDGDIDESLLRGTEAGSVGDGSGHDAHHGLEVNIGNDGDDIGHSHGEKYVHYRQEVHLDSPALKGVEEAGAHLEAYRENKEDKAEFLDETQDLGIGTEAKMAHENADEKNPCGSK